MSSFFYVHIIHIYLYQKNEDAYHTYICIYLYTYIHYICTYALQQKHITAVNRSSVTDQPFGRPFWTPGRLARVTVVLLSIPVSRRSPVQPAFELRSNHISWLR